MKRLTALFGAVFLLFLLGLEGVSHANHLGTIRNSRRLRQEIEIRDYDAIRIERERLDAAAEARREVGRAVRRQEVETELKRSTDDFLASQEAIRLDSEAAANSPRGFYYRKPGSRTSTLPAGSVEVQVEGRSYFYYRGVFYRQDPGAYSVVTAPPGAHIAELPEGHMQVHVDGLKFFYYFGSYYRRDGDGFTVTTPLSGSVVTYLPDGYSTVRSEDGTQYTFGGIRYRPYYQEGLIVYAVQGI